MCDSVSGHKYTMHLPLTHVRGRVQVYMMCILHATHCILCIKVETHLTTGGEIKD